MPAHRDAEGWFAEVAQGFSQGRLAPYLGPGLAAAAANGPPSTAEELAEYLGRHVALPRRARGNLGAAAQYIETHRHRTVVTRLMTEAFAGPPELLPIHGALAAWRTPLIVDTWYHGAMRAALGVRTDWGEIQGLRRSGLGGDRYYAPYDAAGQPCGIERAETWQTLLYEPHGCVNPSQNFLVSDSDYVEAMTEIDIQTPIPLEVQRRRSSLGFVLLGCRLDDQTLRTYARQILKRSAGPHYIAIEPGGWTKNEQRFATEHGLVPLVLPLVEVLSRLSKAAPPH